MQRSARPTGWLAAAAALTLIAAGTGAGLPAGMATGDMGSPGGDPPVDGTPSMLTGAAGDGARAAIGDDVAGAVTGGRSGIATDGPLGTSGTVGGPQGSPTAAAIASDAAAGELAGPGARELSRLDRHAFPFGADLAFQDDLIVAGSANWMGPDDSGVHLYRRDAEGRVEHLSFLHCPAWHADVDFVPDTPDHAEAPSEKPRLVVLSHDAAGDNECDPGFGQEGVGIIDVASPRRPRAVGLAETTHGAHNVTTVGDTGLVYVSSYNLTDPSDVDGVSIVDLSGNPADPQVTFLEFPGPDSSPEHEDIGNESGRVPTAPGCHDIGLDLSNDRAFCAGITETQVWDVSNPLRPVIIAIITNPAINVHHSAEVNRAGDVLVINDEWVGAAGGPTGCLAPRQPTGALWFYDISDPSRPRVLSQWSPPETEPTADFCTSHFFRPFVDDAGRDLLVTSWYEGGLWVVDFTKRRAPRAVASAKPEGAIFWAAYPYKGALYANSFSPATLLGSDPATAGQGGLWVFKLEGYSAPDRLGGSRGKPPAGARGD